MRITSICLILFCTLYFCHGEDIPLGMEDIAIDVEWDSPEKPEDKELQGVLAFIKVFDQITNDFIEYRFMVDTLSCTTWLITTLCNSDMCNPHKKVLAPVLFLGGEITLSTGSLYGNLVLTHIHLKSFILQRQVLFLANDVRVPDFENVSFDGILGLSKYQPNLDIEKTYMSILHNISYQRHSHYFILKLGGSRPYMKFGDLNQYDIQFFHNDSENPGQKEPMEWLDLVEDGVFVLPLRHIKFIYRDAENNIVRWHYAVSHCIIRGCRATFDTKSYFINAPTAQISKFLALKRPDCSDEYFQTLPDIEFSFYSINVSKSKHYSDETVNLTLEPEDYMLAINKHTIYMDDGSELNCIPGIGETGTQYGWNFGIMFLKRFLLAYDFHNEKIGFVRTNNDM